MWSDSLGKIDQLQERLDDLKDAYEDNGLSVSGGLLAPVCEQELRDFCADWFPVDLPDELKKVYLTSFQLLPDAFINVAARAQKWVDQAISRNMY